MGASARSSRSLVVLVAILLLAAGWALDRAGTDRPVAEVSGNDRASGPASGRPSTLARPRTADDSEGIREAAAVPAAVVPEPKGALVRVEGRVVDWKGRPIAGARIWGARPQLFGHRSPRPPDSEVVRSDSNGHFALRSVRVAHGEVFSGVQVAVEHDGFARASVLITDHVEQVMLLPLPVLAGRLLDHHGRQVREPVELEVEVSRGQFDPLETLRTRSGFDGSYRLEGLPVGQVVALSASAPGLAPIALAPDVELRAGETAYLDVVLQTGATVFGRVLDELTGAPVADVLVWAGSIRPEGSAETRTDPGGHFSLSSVGFADSGEDQGEPWVEFVLNALAPSRARDRVLTLRAPRDGRDVYEFEIWLNVVDVEVTGTVRDAGGAPVHRARVFACSSEGSTWRAFTDQDGAFRLGTLPAGPSRVVAWKRLGAAENGYGWYDGELHLTGAEPPLEIALAAGGRAAISARVVSAVALPERLRFRADAFVEHGGTTANLGVGREAIVRRDGSFRFENVLPGLNRIVAPRGALGDPARAYPEQLVVRVAPGATVRGLEFSWLAPFRLSGEVDPGGRPLHLLAVELVDGDGYVVAETRPSADGAFALGPVPPTAYRLVVRLGANELVDRPVGPDSVEGLALFLP